MHVLYYMLRYINRHYAAAAAAEAKSDKPVAPHVASIVDQVSKLNILEVADLVKALQVNWGRVEQLGAI